MRDSRGDEKGQTQPLSAIWARRAEYSGHASTHARTSALAGLAVAWLFAGGSDGQLARLATAPTSLLIAAAIFAASLAADILQYYVGAELFRRLARDQEMHHNKSHDDPVPVQPWIPGVPAAFYNIKVLLLFAGYSMLIAAFVGAVFAA